MRVACARKPVRAASRCAVCVRVARECRSILKTIPPVLGAPASERLRPLPFSRRRIANAGGRRIAALKCRHPCQACLSNKQSSRSHTQWTSAAWRLSLLPEPLWPIVTHLIWPRRTQRPRCTLSWRETRNQEASQCSGARARTPAKRLRMATSTSKLRAPLSSFTTMGPSRRAVSTTAPSALISSKRQCSAPRRWATCGRSTVICKSRWQSLRAPPSHAHMAGE